MKNKESGITLIALIITIILLLILTMVVVRGITGEESIIRVSETATEDYNILQYKEQIEALRESVILKAEIAGETLDISKLAREMSKEGTWLKSAIANVSQNTEGTSITNDDIIVTTLDGYVFQLYYNESYGQKFIEYLGKEDGNGIPNITYTKLNNKITITAQDDISGVNGIEVIYKGDVVKAEKASTLEYEAPKTGWYTIRVTSNKGKLRYAWIRVSSTMIAPKIEIVKPAEKPAAGWYKDKVTVRITAEGDKTAQIYYTTSRWKEDPPLIIDASEKIEGTNIIGRDIEVATQGVTSVYTYAVDSGSGESEIVRYDILIDSEPPKIEDVVITGTKGENNWYRGEVGISLENARDSGSGVDGYYYYIPTEEEITNNYVPTVDEMNGEEGTGKPIGIKTIMRMTEDRNKNSNNSSRG